MSEQTVQALFPLLITAIVIFRFAMRELRERTVKAKTIWLRPGFMVVITLFLIFSSASDYAVGDVEMIAALIGGVILGVITGVLIIANTRFAPAAIPNAVRVQGNYLTLVIWVVAFGLRLLARYVVPHGTDPVTQLPLNCGTVAMAAVAFIVIALAFRREIARHVVLAAPAIATPAPIISNE